MKVKCFLMAVCASIVLGINAQTVNPGIDSELPNPSFELRFNGTLDANISAGDAKPFQVLPKGIDKKERLAQGIHGEALKGGHDKKTGEFYQYLWKADKNCSRESGTIAFWIKPLDWDGTDSVFYNMFFRITNGDEVIQIVKPKDSSQLCLLLGKIASPAQISADISAWKSNEWHFITATWTEKALILYIDGKQVASTVIRKPVSKDFSYIQLGSVLEASESGLSLFDEFRIYPVALDKNQIAQMVYTYANKAPHKQSQSVSSAPRNVKLDGKIDPGEYAFSAGVFYDIKTKNLTSLPVRYFLANDKQNLYVAFQSQKVKNKEEHTSRDGNIWEDDSVEVFLLPGTGNKDFFQLIFNSSGGVFDRNSDVRGKDWNCAELKYVNRITDGIWTIEICIPFSALDVTPPKDNTKWKINLCRTFQDKINPTYCSLTPGAYSNIKQFPALIFKKSMPGVEIESIGNLTKGKLAFKTKIFKDSINDKSEAVCTVESIERGRLFFSERKILATSPPYNVFTLKRNIPTKGQVKIEINSPDGGLLYRNMINYEHKERFKLKFIYTDIPEQILHIIAEADPDTGKKMLVQLIDDRGKTALERRQKIGNNLIYDITLDISSVAPENYRVVLKKDGKESSGKVFEELFRKPPAKPVWKDNKIGISDKVPVPWTNLKTNSKSVSCWGREYNFENAFLCSSIISQGKNILAAPMALRVNGKTEYAKDSFRLKLLSSKENEVKFQQQAHYGNLLVSSDINVEFDGHVWVNMTLEPVGKAPMDISNITFEIPMRSDYAELVHNSTRGHKPGAPDASGLLPEKGWRKNLYNTPAFWVGNEKRGLNWFAENLKGWHCKDARHSLTIEKNKETTLICLNLVDCPMKLDEKRKISFGFIATPARPVNPIPMKDRNQQKYGTVSHLWTKYFDRHCDKNGINWDYIAKMPECFKKLKKERLFYYSSYEGVSPLSADWGYWGKLWMRNPPQIGDYYSDTPVATREERNKQVWTKGCLNCKDFLDFKIWNFYCVFSDPRCGIKDWYFDLASPLMCNNPEHDCRWTDDFGRKHMTYNLLGTRELAKRIYILIKEKNPDSLIAQHFESNRTSVCSFCDRAADGEELVGEVAARCGYYDLVSPDYFRAAFVPETWGVQYHQLCQIYRGMLFRLPQEAAKWDRNNPSPEIVRGSLHFLAYCMLHNTDAIFGSFKYPFIEKPLWNVQDKIGMDKNVKFIPYWSKDKPIITTPESNRILASAYVKQNKLLLVVLNDTDKQEDVSVKLNLKSIMPGVKVPSSWDGKEVFNQEKKSVIKDGVYSVKLPPRGMRLVYWEEK